VIFEEAEVLFVKGVTLQFVPLGDTPSLLSLFVTVPGYRSPVPVEFRPIIPM
jgi:hypothetical protein